LKQVKPNPPHSRGASLAKRHDEATKNCVPSQYVTKALEPLVKRGCSPECLLDYLCAIRLAHDVCNKNRPANDYIPAFTFDGHFGFDRKSLKTVLKRMRQSAKDVGTLSHNLGSGWLLKIFKMKLSRQQREAHAENLAGHNIEQRAGFVVPNIPHALHILADAVEGESKQARFHERPIYDDALEALLVYIRHTTGKWYYEQVGALLRAAVTLKDTPDGASLRVWAQSRPVLRSPFRKS
jgi:hypothetical protein